MKALLICVSVVAGVGYSAYRFNDYENQIVDLQDRVEFAERTQQALLSGGRWVRKYDARNGSSTYTFQAPTQIRAAVR